MAAREIIDAVIQKYNALAFTGKPPTLWFGTPPLKNADGTAVALPIACIQEEPGEVVTTFEHMEMEIPNVKIQVVGTDPTVVISIVKGIMYNGGGPADGLGFQYAASLPFDSTYVFKQMHIVGTVVYDEIPVDRSNLATRVQRATMRFLVQAHYIG